LPGHRMVVRSRRPAWTADGDGLQPLRPGDPPGIRQDRRLSHRGPASAGPRGGGGRGLHIRWQAMNWTMTWLLLALICWMVGTGVVRPSRVYELPFLAGAMAFAFLAPQLPGVANDPTIPEGAYVKMMVMTIL